MHFSIPETREVKEENGSSYVVYRVFINGIFHCEVRFSQLYSLNENLKHSHGQNALPYFPPKKFFLLSKSQLEERQYCLQKYLQSISQNNELVYSPVLRKFLLASQQKNAENSSSPQEFTIYLLNGTQVQVKISFEDSSESVLQKVCEHLRVPQELMQHFSLFVQTQSDSGENHLIHYLQDYECPLLTLENIPKPNKVIIRKSYWDPTIDMTLVRDRSTLNLLYSQTVSDVEKGWIITDKETNDKLATLQSRGAKREYLETARTLKFYGYIRFDGCTSDYPELGTETIISVGQRELIFTPKADNMCDKEARFRITRIRCWKITPLSEFNREVQLSFEYLVSANKLHWITVISEYVYVLSVCLQSIVDELMLKKNGSLAKPNNDSKHQSSKVNSSLPSSISTRYRKPFNTRKLKSNGPNTQLHFIPLLENDSFENIGDDDL